jgi:transposase
VPTNDSFELRTERLGPLPIANHFLERLGVEDLLNRFVPTLDQRYILGHAKALGVLLRSIIVEREPIYRQQETVSTFLPDSFGLLPEHLKSLEDDRIGRALEHLFDADRGALLTELAIGMGEKFSVSLEEIHNDSTTIRLSGHYRRARGRALRGKRGPWITYGHSKDHRPDLKQLLFILSSSADGGIPVQFRCGDGNSNDAKTHIETWEALRKVAGTVSFLYVADSKLCTRENMDHIDKAGGRFVTVLPRSRLEDSEFRSWIQKNEPAWELAWDRPNPRRRYGPRDRWWVFRFPIPSKEGWPVIWVYSSLLALRQEEFRREHIARAVEELSELKEKLRSRRTRIRSAYEVDSRVQEILHRTAVADYVRVERTIAEEHTYRQATKGRPGPQTQFVRKTRRRHDISWRIDELAIAYDRKSDGMYPLLTNDKTLSPERVLQAHKEQPKIEKRFEQTKTVHEIAPVFLKNEDRIEALFLLYFIALVVQALIERELRKAMAERGIEELPLYPEERRCRRPTTEQVFRLFSRAERHVLSRNGDVVQVFQAELTPLQREILDLLGVPLRLYAPT